MKYTQPPMFIIILYYYPRVANGSRKKTNASLCSEMIIYCSVASRRVVAAVAPKQHRREAA